jgi:predicted small secreted protein
MNVYDLTYIHTQMKRTLEIILMAVVIALSITACSTTNQATGVQNVGRGKFTGTWTVSSVDYQGLVENAVANAFDEAKPSAFIGSTWKLTNSGNGMYTLTSGVSQSIFWSINNTGPNGQMFQFKKIYEGDKAKNVQQGYQLLVGSNNGNTMVLKTPVAIGNSTGYVVYTFNKQ